MNSAPPEYLTLQEAAPVPKPAVSCYAQCMDKRRRYTTLLAALIALGLGVLAARAAFAGWLEHGPAIFLSLAESGMSWCF
ncbi:hypothetical protein BSY16_646 [Sinorhizobium sp. RAC02]|nr:hypothetical protein BSY16_646 [Sinorhizobium sp. RAC02]